jgi:hypothetical protein
MKLSWKCHLPERTGIAVAADARIDLRRHQLRKGTVMFDAIECPLYLNDAQLGVAVLGRDRAHEWPLLAQQLEAFIPLPRIHQRMKGRFWPDIVEYFRRLNSIDEFNDKLAKRITNAAPRRGLQRKGSK